MLVEGYDETAISEPGYILQGYDVGALLGLTGGEELFAEGAPFQFGVEGLNLHVLGPKPTCIESHHRFLEVGSPRDGHGTWPYDPRFDPGGAGHDRRVGSQELSGFLRTGDHDLPAGLNQADTHDGGKSRVFFGLLVSGINDGHIGPTVAQILLRQGPQVVIFLDGVDRSLLSWRGSADLAHPKN